MKTSAVVAPTLYRRTRGEGESVSRRRSRLQMLAVVALILGVGIFHTALLREGIAWFGDAPSYVQHARNLAEGQPYGKLNYVPNPGHFLAPASYPPGYPLVLAPAIAIFGVNVTAMKAVAVVAFVLALFVLALLFRRELSFPALLFLLGAVGLFPFFWMTLQEITPGVVFLLAVYLSLWSYQKGTEALEAGGASARRAAAGWAVAAGMALCWAVLTRWLGAALLLSFIGYDLVRWRRPRRVLIGVFCTVAVLGGCALLLGEQQLAQGSLSSSEGGYLALVQENILNRLGSVVRRLPLMLLWYAHHLNEMWANGYSIVLRYVVFLALAPFLIIGFWNRLTRSFSVLEVFGLVYLASLLPWSFAHARYLIPLIPLYFFYALVGAGLIYRWCAARGLGPKKYVWVVAGALAVFGSYVARYSTLDYGPVRSAVTSQDAQDLYAYLQQHTDEQDVVVALFPRQLAFFAERPTSVPHRHGPDERHLAYFRRIGAEYLLVGPSGEKRPWTTIWFSMGDLARRHPECFRPAFENATYELYEITPCDF